MNNLIVNALLSTVNQTEGEKMTINDYLTLAALIIIPIVAVVIAQWLQNRSEKRKDKMQIFKTLMTSRIYGWTPDSVNALNIIDIVYSDDKKVRAAWKDLNDKYRVTNPDQQHLKKIENAQYKLLEAMANSLGYKDKITWETIQNPYMPVGMAQQIEAQKNMQQAYYSAINGVNNFVQNQKQNPNTDASSSDQSEKNV
nr:DUF6680 family protein [uncultured Ruminococcus sp.]